MDASWTRRRLLGASLATGAALAGGRARAATRTLNILAHRVHQNSLTTGAAGDLTQPWREANQADLAWTTFDTDPLQDRLFREASLDRTDFGVGFLVNSRATPNAARLLQPLGEYQSAAAIEEFGDIAPGLTQAMTINGQLIGIPFRHATIGLFYNEALLESRGITAPPSSLEELLDQAKRMTFRSEDGRPVTGMVLASELTVFPVTFARAFGGDFIGNNLTLVPNPEALEKGIGAMRALFEAGALPRSYATTTNDEQVTWMQQGRAAFTVLPFARHAQLNNREQSRFPGRIKAMEFPLSESLRGKEKMSSVTEFWAMSIPHNARDKELGWNFIRAMSSRAATLGAARNGNGPVRVSTYKDPGFAASQPLAEVESKALENARVPLPAFPEAARAQSIFVEEVQLAVLGRKTPKEAVAALATRVRPLLPS
ncbi:extracellular solute-binding protein [Roseomonas sp. BN140053]|uniref:extracellular solute-binding protein n=1 Tax=Roseomonas sp. BN140053 TaxID=3391898 RepID=UPI0039EA90EA